VHDALTVAEVEGVSNRQHYLCDLFLILAAVEIVGGVEFAALTELHDDVEESRVVIDFVNLDDVGVFELDRNQLTERSI
jgi:hypothetical protein